MGGLGRKLLPMCFSSQRLSTGWLLVFAIQKRTLPSQTLSQSTQRQISLSACCRKANMQVANLSVTWDPVGIVDVGPFPNRYSVHTSLEASLEIAVSRLTPLEHLLWSDTH